MPDLSSNSAKELLGFARVSIKTHILTGDPIHPLPKSEELKVNRGCFVTLRIDGKLRGCVGTFNSSEPLCENVIRMAVAAASQDTRFAPVAKGEIDSLHIDISILGEPERVESFEDIQIGLHGVLIKHGSRSGTFLPEVAVEQQWNAMEFVTFCAREKAGLSPKECGEAEIFRYEVQKISE